MAGFASRPSFAGHADDSASERHPLTFKLDHSMGAGHSEERECYCTGCFLDFLEQVHEGAVASDQNQPARLN